MPEYNSRYTSRGNFSDKNLKTDGLREYNSDRFDRYNYDEYDGVGMNANPDLPPNEDGFLNKRFFRLPLIAVQSISCVIIILIVFLLKSIGGNAFNQLKKSFNELIMKNSVVSTFAAWFDTKDENSDENSKAAGGSDKSGSDSSGPATQPTTGSSEENDEGTAPSVKSEESGEAAAPSAQTTVGAASNMTQSAQPVSYQIKGSGSKSADVRLTGGRVVFAPPGATFAPLKINIKAKLPLEAGRVTSGFEYRINPFDTEDEEFHSGLDIGAPEGANISSIYYGVVAETGESPSYGKYIVMDHGNGLKTLYAHCSKILAEKNKVIKAGETIAQVGSTGKSTGNHLHIEIILNGVKYDPQYLLDTSRLKSLDDSSIKVE